jgi:phosphatidylserine/phosphatidylglycerophosphate/cardiolipin synthase-like enzyme
MVVDECIVVAGSFNYTQRANDYNDESIFVLGHLSTMWETAWSTTLPVSGSASA